MLGARVYTFVTVILGALLSLSPLPAAAQSPSGWRKVALVIGNSAYKEAPLKNPANDARAMAAKLRGLGFEVIALENATQAQMTAAIIDFSERLTDEGVALVYFAGHGMQVKGRNFLIPVDARISSEASVRNATVDANQILESIGDANRRTNIVILDACRNNPFGRFRGGGGGSGLASIAAPTGTLIAYATAPGMTASDGNGENGTYTAEILQAMDEPGLRVEDLFKRVRAHVVKLTGSAQVPWESSSLVGDFYFLAPTALTVTVVPPAPPPPPPPSDAADKEVVFWQSVSGSPDPGAFEAYLKQYPQGAFAELARFRIQQMQRTAAANKEIGKDPANPPPPAPASIEVEEISGRYVVVRRAHVRKAPSTAAAIVRTMEPGARLTATGRQRDGDSSGVAWLRVAGDTPGQQEGWVASANLETEEEATARRRKAAAETEAQTRRKGSGDPRQQPRSAAPSKRNETGLSDEARRVAEAERAFAQAQQEIAAQREAQERAKREAAEGKKRGSSTPEKPGLFRQMIQDINKSFSTKPTND